MPQQISTKALTQQVRKLGEQIISVTDDGSPISRNEALAQMLWDMALGHTSRERDTDGTMREVYHPPVAWCAQYIYERQEGRSPTAVPENDTRIRAADRVRDLAKARLNKIAVAVAGPPQHKPPKS